MSRLTPTKKLGSHKSESCVPWSSTGESRRMPHATICPYVASGDGLTQGLLDGLVLPQARHLNHIPTAMTQLPDALFNLKMSIVPNLALVSEESPYLSNFVCRASPGRH